MFTTAFDHGMTGRYVLVFTVDDRGQRTLESLMSFCFTLWDSSIGWGLGDTPTSYLYPGDLSDLYKHKCVVPLHILGLLHQCLAPTTSPLQPGEVSSRLEHVGCVITP